MQPSRTLFICRPYKARASSRAVCCARRLPHAFQLRQASLIHAETVLGVLRLARRVCSAISVFRASRLAWSSWIVS